MAPPIDYMTDVSAEATVFFLTFASKWPEPNIIIFMHFNYKVIIVIVDCEMLPSVMLWISQEACAIFLESF